LQASCRPDFEVSPAVAARGKGNLAGALSSVRPAARVLADRNCGRDAHRRQAAVGAHGGLCHSATDAGVGEIAVLPLAFGDWQIALIWSIPDAVLLRYRIGVEMQALSGRELDRLQPLQGI
jgi:hypothetical protein